MDPFKAVFVNKTGGHSVCRASVEDGASGMWCARPRGWYLVSEPLLCHGYERMQWIYCFCLLGEGYIYIYIWGDCMCIVFSIKSSLWFIFFLRLLHSYGYNRIRALCGSSFVHSFPHTTAAKSYQLMIGWLLCQLVRPALWRATIILELCHTA